MSEQKTLNFNFDDFEFLFDDVAIVDAKSCTLRKYQEGLHDFEPGEKILGNFQDIIVLLEIEAIEIKKFCELDFEDVCHSGYMNPQELFEDYKRRHYANLEWHHRCAIIRFKLAKTP